MPCCAGVQAVLSDVRAAVVVDGNTEVSCRTPTEFEAEPLEARHALRVECITKLIQTQSVHK